MEKETKKRTEAMTPRKGPKKPTMKKADVRKKAKDLLETGRERLSHIPFQSIWDRFKKEAKVAVEAIGKGTEKAAGKTVVMSKQAGLQYQAYLNHLKLRNALAELGGRIYDLSKANSESLILKDPEAMPMIDRIAELDQKILKLKGDAKSLKKS